MGCSGAAGLAVDTSRSCWRLSIAARVGCWLECVLVASGSAQPIVLARMYGGIGQAPLLCN
jgi:hypothetical protein